MRFTEEHMVFTMRQAEAGTPVREAYHIGVDR